METNNTFESNTTLDTNADTILETVDTGNYMLADTDEFAEDDKDYEFPLMQNVHRENIQSTNLNRKKERKEEMRLKKRRIMRLIQGSENIL